MRAFVLFWLVMAPCLHAAGLAFEATTVEVEVAADAKVAVVDFNFENKTDRLIHIAKYNGNCSCLSVAVSGNGKRDYAPGEQGTIRAMFELGNLVGLAEKQIELWVDQDPINRPSHVLLVRARIPELIVMDAKTLAWERGGPAEPRRISLRIQHSKPIRVRKVECGSDNFRAVVNELEPGKHYELEVTPVSTDRVGLANIRLLTDCEIPRHQSRIVFATVEPRRKDAVAGAPAVGSAPEVPNPRRARVAWVGAAIASALVLFWGLRWWRRGRG